MNFHIATLRKSSKTREAVWANPFFGGRMTAKHDKAHFILAELEKSKTITITTQNVDGLHQMAGSKRVLELHGTLSRARCRDCFWSVSIGKMHEILDKGEKDTDV